MQRRSFLKLIGAIVLAPSLPVSAKLVLAKASPYFIYKGYKFRKDRLLRIDVIQLYIETEISGERYCNALWIDPEDWKYRDMYCDNMIHAMKRTKQRLENNK